MQSCMSAGPYLRKFDLGGGGQDTKFYPIVIMAPVKSGHYFFDYTTPFNGSLYFSSNLGRATAPPPPPALPLNTALVNHTSSVIIMYA